MTQSTWTPTEAQAAIDQITMRAAKDAAFRTLCLTSPADAVREVTGRELPEGFVLRFADNAHADLTVVLPDLEAKAEISDADLGTVAGGITDPRQRYLEKKAWRAAHPAEREEALQKSYAVLDSMRNRTS